MLREEAKENHRPKTVAVRLRFFAIHDEVKIALSILLYVANQLIEIRIKSNPLNAIHIQHVDNPRVADGLDLRQDGFCHGNDSHADTMEIIAVCFVSVVIVVIFQRPGGKSSGELKRERYFSSSSGDRSMSLPELLTPRM